MQDFASALVSGSTGFIGSALVRRLSAAGKRVFCLTRQESTNLERIASLTGVEVLTVPSFLPQDLCNTLGRISADVVFHLAAYGVTPEDRNPQLMVDGNVGLITGLLLAVKDWPLKKFIHTGSCAEYGEQIEGKLIAENAPLDPLSLYGAAKAASVLYGSTLAKHLNVPFVVLRLFGVYGQGEARKRLLPYLIESLAQDLPAELTPGEQIRDLLHIADVTDSYLQAAITAGTEGIYNVCSGIPLSVHQISHSVAAAMGKPANLFQWGKKPYRPDEPMWLVGDNTRFRRDTGWKPSISLEEGINAMLKGTITNRQKAKQKNDGWIR